MYRSRKFRRTQGKKKERGPPGPPVLPIPAGHRKMKEEIKQAVKESGLDIQVKERAGVPLRSMLCSSALRPTECKNVRGRLCQDGGHGGEGGSGRKPKCDSKDLVYQITCGICNEFYIGETVQPIADRFRQHFPSGKLADKDSSVAMHHTERHPEQEPNLEVVVLGRGGGFVRRKTLEGTLIQKKQPQINKLMKDSESREIDLFLD